MIYHGNRLSNTLQQRWRAGNIKPVRDFEKGCVKDFKTNLRYRILPALKEGDDALLKKLEIVMYDFLAYLYNPEISSLIKINERMAVLPNREPFRKGIISWLTLNFQNTSIRHIIALGIISAGCFAFGYALVAYGISLADSVSDSLILIGILFGTYYGISWSQTRTK
jgi:hypothetical protein